MRFETSCKAQTNACLWLHIIIHASCNALIRLQRCDVEPKMGTYTIKQNKSPLIPRHARSYHTSRTTNHEPTRRVSSLNSYTNLHYAYILKHEHSDLNNSCNHCDVWPCLWPGWHLEDSEQDISNSESYTSRICQSIQ